MSSEEVRRARLDVRESQVQFEEAVDHLKVKIESGGGITEELLHKPKVALDHFVAERRVTAEKYLQEKRVLVEGYVTETLEALGQTVQARLRDTLAEAKETVTQSLEDASQSAESHVGDLQNAIAEVGSSAKETLSGIENELVKVGQNAKSTLTELESSLTGFIANLQNSAQDGLKLMDERPLATWITVFLSGWMLGLFMHRISKSGNVGIHSITSSNLNSRGKAA